MPDPEREQIVCFTAPDHLRQITLAGTIDSYPYETIEGVWRNEEGYLMLEGRGVSPPSELAQREVSLTPTLADRLIRSFKAIRAGQTYNCFRFCRDMLGLQTTNADSDAAPLVTSLEGTQSVETLALGEVAVIGAKGDEERLLPDSVDHSIVGLGEDVPEILQVPVLRSPIAIADREIVISYYRRFYGTGEETGIHPIDPPGKS